MAMKSSLLALLVLAAAAWAPNGHSLIVRHLGTVSAGPDKDPLHESNYKEETQVRFLPVTVEFIFASLFIALIGSVPFLLLVLAGPGNKLTKAHFIESGCLIVWLVTVLILFTNFLSFNSGSGHWDGARPLTIVEAVYVLAQILTTVGYGDITPAYPVAQVWVAINVILALCLYGSIVMEVADMVTQKMQKALAEIMGTSTDEEDEEVHAARMAEAEKPLKDWTVPKTVQVNYSNLQKSAAAFAAMVFIGILFWHYYPGEEKTWLQAVYFCVITLSTVGFGAITATTPGGMVFGAFWMLFGVAALAGVIGSFVQVMIQVKANQREDADRAKLAFYRHVRHCAKPKVELDDHCMDSYDFLKFGVLLDELATPEEIQHIEARFVALCSVPDGTISSTELVAAEAPAGYDFDVKCGGAKTGDA